MKRGTMILLGIVGAILIVVGWFISAGNGLIQKDESVKAAWSQVENVYQRRMDLIPNLVETVKGYAKHESQTLEEVTKARSQAVQVTQSTASNAPNDQKKLAEFQRSQENLGAALGRLMVVVEKYPDLKANQNFRDLQVQLEGTENRIATERRRFNEVAQDYNASIRMFPTSIVASSKGMQPRAYFEAQAGAATAPKVSF
jgi:LemA protein